MAGMQGGIKFGGREGYEFGDASRSAARAWSSGLDKLSRNVRAALITIRVPLEAPCEAP